MSYDKDRIPQKPLKWYRGLSTDKGRREAGAFLVEGDRAIQQIIGARPDAIIEIVAFETPPSVCGDYPVRLLTESKFDSISQAKTPQGPLAVVRIPPDIYSARLPDSIGQRVLLLEDIQDPGNVGTLIRTAAAFGYGGIILTDRCADPLSPKCVQSAAGTVLSLHLRRTARYLDLIKSLKDKGYCLIATDLNGSEDPSLLNQPNKMVLALGNEAAGLSQMILEIADHRFRVPIDRHRAESLNVGACGAICMYLSVCR